MSGFFNPQTLSDHIDTAAIAGKICRFVEAGNIHARFYRREHFQDAKRNALGTPRRSQPHRLSTRFTNHHFQTKLDTPHHRPQHSEALRHPRVLYRGCRYRTPNLSQSRSSSATGLKRGVENAGHPERMAGGRAIYSRN